MPVHSHRFQSGITGFRVYDSRDGYISPNPGFGDTRLRRSMPCGRGNGSPLST